MSSKNDTTPTKADKPAAKAAETERQRTVRASALDIPADDERKRLRDAAAATAEGVEDKSQLIEVDANRVEFHLSPDAAAGPVTISQRVLDRETTEDVPPDIIKVDPTKVRFSPLAPDTSPPSVSTDPRPPVLDSYGSPVNAPAPAEAFRKGEAPQDRELDTDVSTSARK